MTILVLCALGGFCDQVAGADALPLAPKLAATDPLAKVAPTILPYLLDERRPVAELQHLSVRTHAVGLIAARLDVPVTPETLLAIGATGAHILASSPRWNSVSIDATAAQLRALANLAEVKQILLRRHPRYSGLDQGDAVMHTDTLRSTYGVTGAGRTIGMISDSIDDTFSHPSVAGIVPFAVLSGIAPQVASSPGPYLPAAIKVIDFGPGGGTDEGEAMLEEVFSIAPGAPLAFASSGSTDTEMATNISELASDAGCTIIGDDVSYLDEPCFQDGPIAQAINTFQAAGNLYFSSAGNNGNSGIMMNYQRLNVSPEVPPYATPVTGGNFHDWGQGGTTPGYLPVIVPAGATLDFVLDWNQPYSSWNLGAGSQSDFDIYAYASPSTTTLLASSNGIQGSAGEPEGDPNEIMEYTNPNPPDIPPSTAGSITIYIAVDHYTGLPSALLRVIIYGDGVYTPPAGNPLYNAPACFGHCTANGCLAVAAVPYTSPTQVEPFSSKGGWGAGGIPFYFDNSGVALSSPQLRDKPDLTAPDGISTSTVAFTPFFGTSAATPNAAACAELVWRAQPNESNAQIVQRLEATAGSVTSPDSPQPNDYTGFGLVNGLAAASGTTVSSITSSDPSGVIYGGIVPITVTFSQAVTVTGTPTLTLNTVPTQVATYVSNNGSGGLLFDYQVVNGDNASPLDAASAGALQLNGGTIVDTQHTAVSLILPAPGASRSLSNSKQLDITAVPPVLTITAPTSTSATSFGVTFSFSQPVVGFTAASVTLSNATAGTFTAVDSSTYTLVVVPTAPGPVLISVAAGVQNPFAQSANGASAITTYSLAHTNGGTAGAGGDNGGYTVGHGGACGLGGGAGLISLLAGLGWWRRRRSV